jgi:hypothetical protein
MKSFGSNQVDFHQLLLNWPNVEEPYSLTFWQTIIDGLVDSFKTYTGIGFTIAEPFWADLNHVFPILNFKLIHTLNVPIHDIVYYAIGGITTYQQNQKKYIQVTISLFMFLGNIRLLGRNLDNPLNDYAYIYFTFDNVNSNSFSWTNHGWRIDEYGEWLELYLPN